MEMLQNQKYRLNQMKTATEDLLLDVKSFGVVSLSKNFVSITIVTTLRSERVAMEISHLLTRIGEHATLCT